MIFNCKAMVTEMFEYFKDDIKRYCPGGITEKLTFLKIIKIVFLNEQLWLIGLYRYRKWIKNNIKNKIIMFLLKIPYGIFSRPLMLLYGIHIEIEAEIGKGLYIGHHGGIWIGPAKIGDYCNISQEVTIGMGLRGINLEEVPIIGGRVYIGPGAKIFGMINIGNNVAIGANAVVSKNLPNNAVAVGNPARIVSYEGSEGIVRLD